MARAAKLTDSMIKKARLASGQKRAILWDAKITGLGVRLIGNSKIFWFQYRKAGTGRAGTARMVRIGTWPEVTLDDARRAARALAGKVARDKDPAEERKEERRRATSTLRELLAQGGEYEQNLERRRVVNAKVALSSLNRGLKGLMAKEVADITQGELVNAIDALDKRGKPGAAGDLRKFARVFLSWAVEKEYAKTNVLLGLQRPRKTKAEKLDAVVLARKPRALSDAEIVTVWHACEGRGSFGNLVRLLLLTGCRRGELAKLERGSVLADRLALPPLSTKTGVQHDVPLTALMRTVIAAQPTTTSALVFPSERTSGAMSGWTKAVKALQQDSGVDFTLHDLRRTCRTLMSRLGVDNEIAELAIGHRRADLEGRYNKDIAWQPRCEAFIKVSDYVNGLLKRDAMDGKVVAMVRG